MADLYTDRAPRHARPDCTGRWRVDAEGWVDHLVSMRRDVDERGCHARSGRYVWLVCTDCGAAETVRGEVARG